MTDTDVVTLLTDFDDFYVSAMKGVLSSRTDARTSLVDIYHSVPPQDVRAASFILSNVAAYFPDGTVHCVVVDPGVGTDRRAVVGESGGQYFVGPDNGVLLRAMRRLGEPTVYDYVYEDAKTESNTFHGRDVFAPAAADVAEGEFEFADENEIDGYVDLDWETARLEDGSTTAEVVYVDSFGNVVTNLDGDEMVEEVGYGSYIEVDGRRVAFERTYAGVGDGEPVCTVGSHGNFEISVNHGSGSDEFGLSSGDRVEMEIGV
ncbi:S-adenosyl-l-methionine hydroxide adenosyltransferase family protein [Halorutilales archaeon Cl-col2-1]